MTLINFSLTVIASLPCTNYMLSRLQAFSKVFSIKIGEKKKLSKGAADHKIPIWTVQSFLNDSRKTEAGNYSITALAVASGKYPINTLAAEDAQGC